MYQKPGQPEPEMITIDSEYPLRITVIDDRRALEKFTVYLDNELLGQTAPHGPGVTINESDCGQDAHDCIMQGFSIGYCDIPSGKNIPLF
jgi:hypothetical protein